MSYPNQQPGQYPTPGSTPGYPQGPLQSQYGAFPQAPAGFPPAPQGYPTQHQYGAPPGPPPSMAGYPSQPQYGAPPKHPPAQYGAPPGPPPGGNYGAPSGPPPQNSYYAPPPGPPGSYAHPPGGSPPTAGQYPPQTSFAPPPGPPQQQQALPQAYIGGYTRPALVFLGVAVPPPPPNQPAPPVQGYDPGANVETIRKATKGFGTDETALTRTLAPLNALQVDALTRAFAVTAGRPLEQVIEKETGGYFAMGLRGIVLGPVMWDVGLANKALAGPGTHEDLLTEILLGRTNDEMQLLKEAYRAKYHRSLEDAVRGDLSAKTERLFNMALAAGRAPDSTPVNQNQVNDDVAALYKAGQGKTGTDEVAFCSIMVNRSNPHLNAVGVEYQRKYKTTLTKAIKKEFSGHMKDALLFIAHGTKRDGQGVLRDAKMLEASMKGMGTKDERLIWRIVRAHWNRPRMEAVKAAYQTKYKKNLASRVGGETGGDYKKLMLALIG